MTPGTPRELVTLWVDAYPDQQRQLLGALPESPIRLFVDEGAFYRLVVGANGNGVVPQGL